MTIERLKNGRIKMDFESKAFHLMERVVKALQDRGITPMWLNGIGFADELDQLKEGDKIVSVRTVYRSNATSEDVSAEIAVSEVKMGRNYMWEERLMKIKVPKDASDKVIGNRIDKISKYL